MPKTATTVTKLAADGPCHACGSQLVPPNVVSDFKVPASADYVCLSCGRAYWWMGNPPMLTVLRILDTGHH
jgi:DNA-directed RNA polymerase subunit RPC12/RpoP